MPESEAHAVVQVAQRILKEFERVNASKPENQPRIGMSIGVAQIDQSRPVNSEELIRHADEALYAAKSTGKGRVMVRARDGVKAPGGDDAKVKPDRSVAW